MLRFPIFCTGFFLVGSSFALAIPVVNWVTTNGVAGYEEGTAATSSPVTTNADADTLIGSFPSVTLAVGETISLTGSVVISGRIGGIPGGQFRWGFFDAPGVPETADGNGYVGVWASVAGSPFASELRTANGSTDNPFSGTASTGIGGASNGSGGNLQPDVNYTFGMSIARVDDFNISVSASITDGADFFIEWIPLESAASPTSFTYDSVGILLGSTIDATKATFTDIEVSTDTDTPEILEVTAINYNVSAGMITLTWSSVPGKTYAIETGTDLMTWPGNISDGVEAAEGEETTSYSFEDSGLGDKIYFRVRDLSN